MRAHPWAAKWEELKIMSAADLNAHLAEAIRLAQAGQRAEARAILEGIVSVDPERDLAWLWLATVSTDQAERVAFLERALEINPESTTAQTAYERLTGHPYYSSAPAPAASLAPRSSTRQPSGSTLSRLDKSRSLMIWSLAALLIFFAVGAVLVMFILDSQNDEDDDINMAPVLAPTFTLEPGVTEADLPAPGITLAPSETPFPTHTPGPSPTPVTLPPTWTPSMTITVPPSSTPITWTPRPPSETPSSTPDLGATQTAEFVLTSDAPAP